MFRPSFTLAEIETIITLCQCNPHSNACNVTILAKLLPYQLKITHGLVSPAYTASDTHTIGAKLGFSEELEVKDTMSVEEKRLRAYNAYITNPILCTPEQINNARQYMYDHDLMSEEEALDFEATSMGEFNG